MMSRIGFGYLWVLLIILAGCANQTTPTGGKKDITPPKLTSIAPTDSLKNVRSNKIELVFDEYITLTDANKEITISPILSVPLAVTANNKKVIVKIADSLLETNTTYRISFGTAIRDLHESNVFNNYTYTFSTGSYFDSLQLHGKVYNAATGLVDTSGISVLLYYATDNDSAIVQHKPKYITKVNNDGTFIFKGLPKRSFKIFALKDANDNMVYDGGNEMVAFSDTTIATGDSTMPDVSLALFAQPDTSAKTEDNFIADRGQRVEKPVPVAEGFTYGTSIDTTNIARRSFDINKNINISFNRTPAINKDKILLSYDSSGTMIVAPFQLKYDTLHKNDVGISTTWLENTVYTLKLAKGFVKDSAGNEPLPSKYTFRTKQDEDYGKITIHLPAKYKGPQYVLTITTEQDTIYQKPVTDTNIVLTRLAPTKYSFKIIEDKNGNGKWDPGILLEKKQPEHVIPYPNDLNLKPGWENIIDFDEKQAKKKGIDRGMQ